MRWDEAAFVVTFIFLVMLAGLGMAEVLAQVLKPVSDVLMSGTKDITQVALQ